MPKVSIELDLIQTVVKINAEPGDSLLVLDGHVIGVQKKGKTEATSTIAQPETKTIVNLRSTINEVPTFHEVKLKLLEYGKNGRTARALMNEFGIHNQSQRIEFAHKLFREYKLGNLGCADPTARFKSYTVPKEPAPPASLNAHNPPKVQSNG